MILYNTLTHRKELFSPASDPATVYVCGITPYDTTHLGHLFTYSTYDVLIRYLKYQGYRVRYAQNVTDIDDDVLKRAAEAGEDWKSLGQRWTIHFIEDNQALNILPPDVYPRATDVIREIQDAVGDLLKTGLAYEANGSVYFHIEDDKDYGKLSGLSHDQMLPIANERGNFPNDPDKKDPLDFVLWQAQKPGEPAWESPWGRGRPGWHIECSTMSTKYLRLPVDIHGGGVDLVFPHHESEIAQAECGTGQRPFTRFWVHVAMLRYQGEKMSKSLGNMVMVRDLLLAGWSAVAIRLCMASHHYREEWNYSEDKLLSASRLAEKFSRAAAMPGNLGEPIDASSAITLFRAAMDDDLDTPRAIAVLAKLAEDIVLQASSRNVEEARAVLVELCGILGLRLDSDRPDIQAHMGWEEHKRRFQDGV